MSHALFATGDDRAAELAALERKLARALRSTFPGVVVPQLREAADLTGESRLSHDRAARALAALERLNGSLTPAPGMQRRVRAIVEQLAGLGMVDVRGELAAALRGTGQSVAEALASPTRISREDARLYDRLAGSLVQAQVREHVAQVRDEVVRGLEAGITDRELGARIDRLGATRLRSHADTWARTETTRYYTLGRMRLAEEAGDWVWGYRFAVIVDDRTTDICRPYAGRVVAKADLKAVPPFHWNCRTTLVPVTAAEAKRRGLRSNLGDAQPADGFGADPRELVAWREAA